MDWLWKVLVATLAGAGAGVGTGFAGLSAAVFIAPALVAILGIPAYEAVCIALASDVLASAVSAFDYHKNGNINLKNAKYLLGSVLLFTVLGSYVAELVHPEAMDYVTIIGPLVLSLKFLLFPGHNISSLRVKSTPRKILESLVFGAVIGFVCGFIGTGGGLVMLLVLNVVLGYDIKQAIGTSVFVMAFAALIGAGSRVFLMGYMPDPLLLGVSMISTLLFAHLSARIANRAKPYTLNLITGGLLAGCSLLMLICNLLGISIA